MRRQRYALPQLVKHENLKQVTAEWQCSVDTHKNQRGNGHSSHGNGNGYGHCKDR
ncbi:MAG: hypothetical protein ACYC1B_08415 [Thermoleophilia bacterium]